MPLERKINGTSRKKKKYYEQFYAHKIKNLEKRDNFLKDIIFENSYK